MKNREFHRSSWYSRSTSEWWKAESSLEPPTQHGSLGMENQRPNQYVTSSSTIKETCNKLDNSNLICKLNVYVFEWKKFEIFLLLYKLIFPLSISISFWAIGNLAAPSDYLKTAREGLSKSQAWLGIPDYVQLKAVVLKGFLYLETYSLQKT